MQTTNNIGLKTYEANDPTDWLGEFNYNMNKIDEAVGSQNDTIDVIEETAGTAVTTANTASATATEALTAAESKTSVNDNVASATTTYSSNKIDELISGAGGAVIDDTETSTTKTWSSNKINSEINDINVVPKGTTGSMISGNLTVQSRPDRPNELILTIDDNLTVEENGYYLPILYIQSTTNTTAVNMSISMRYYPVDNFSISRFSFPGGFSKDNVHTITAHPIYIKTTDAINAEIDITTFTDSSNKSAPNLVWLELRKMDTMNI